jgi:hypothetical protein
MQTQCLQEQPDCRKLLDEFQPDRSPALCEPSTEFAADVLLCTLLAGILKDLLRVAELDQVTSPPAVRPVDKEKTGLIGHALGLLKVVRHNRDREP